MLTTPLMLLGLAAVAIPIALHLRDRASSQPIDWPTLRFLKVTNREASRRSKLKNLLVLLARCLILILIALAMAKPFTTSEGFNKPGDRPTTLTIVLDNSFSMGYRDGTAAESTRFERARRIALDQIDGLGANDEVAVILAADAPVVLTERPTRAKESARALVREAKPSKRTTDLAAALSTAFAVGNLDADTAGASDASQITEAPAKPDDAPKAPRPRRDAWRQVLLLTDMQQSAWKSLIDSKALSKAKEPLPVTVVDLGSEDATNRFIRRVNVRDDTAGGVVVIEAELGGRASGVTGSNQATLWIDEQRAGSPEAIPSVNGGTSPASKVTFRAPLPAPGVHACSVTLDEDRLPIDDRWFFSLTVSDNRQLVVIDGSPLEVPSLSGAFYFDTALALRGVGNTAAVRRLTTGQLASSSLPQGGAVALVNVARLDGAALTRIENFLRAGGSLLVAPGDNSDITHMAVDWRFLPVRLDRVLGDAAKARSYAIRVDQPEHPIFAGQIDLSAARNFQFAGADPASLRPGGRILASFSNGSPAVVEGVFGGDGGDPATAPGRVLLFTGGLDNRWSNLPYRRAFVPLVDRIASWLTRGKLTSRVVTLGQPVTFSGPSTLDRRTLLVNTPGKASATLTAELDAASAQAIARFNGTTEPGVYRVQADEGFATGGAFAVNVDTRESVLTTVAPDALASAFGELPLRVVKQPTGSIARWNPLAQDERTDRTTEYWTWLLLLAFAVFVAESFLANYFTRRRKPAPLPTTEYRGSRRTDVIASSAGPSQGAVN